MFWIFQLTSQVSLKVAGSSCCFKIDSLRRAFQAWHSVLGLELIVTYCRLAGYFPSSVMHSCAHVLLDGEKKLHVLLNLIGGSKLLLISIM